jgi:hypothetical protein
MLIFFDFLCYSIDQVYRNFRKNSDGSPDFSAGIVVSALQAFNIMSGVMALGMIVQEQYLSKSLTLAVFGALIIINYIRYIQIEKLSIDSIKKKWDMKSIDYQKNSKFFQGLYVIVSVVLVFALAIYVGLNRP